MDKYEMTYTVVSPKGITDFIYADSMQDAYDEAKDLYGEGVMIRPSWYGEWECGTKEVGACYYDEFGFHVVKSKDNVSQSFQDLESETL